MTIKPTRQAYQAPTAVIISTRETSSLLRQFSIDGEFEGINLDEESYG